MTTLRNELRAVQAIEAVIGLQGKPSAKTRSGIAGCDVALLDAAVAFAIGTFKTHARHVILLIGRLAAFLDGNGMTAAPVGGWQPTAEALARHRVDPFGADFERRRADRLPSDAFLAAFIEAYGLATEEPDVVIVSISAILLSVSGRPNEALSIEEDPWVNAITRDGIKASGLRWRGSKGFPDHVKWLIAGTEELVQDALQRLEEVTAEGRRIKAHYDSNPVSLYLPPHLEHLRGSARLSRKDAATLLGRSLSSNLDAYVVRKGLVERPGAVYAGAADEISFAAVEAHILKRLPRRMRDAGGPTSHPLLILREGTFARRKRGIYPSPSMFEVVTSAQLRNALNPSVGRISTLKGLNLDPGSKLRVCPHMFRHRNETLLTARLSQDDRAVWAGRADPRQNPVYDHEPCDRLRDLASRARRQDAGSPTGTPKP